MTALLSKGQFSRTFHSLSSSEAYLTNRNSTNVLVSNVICRGGNGIAFGSLGQYFQFNDNVENVLVEDVQVCGLGELLPDQTLISALADSFTGFRPTEPR